MMWIYVCKQSILCFVFVFVFICNSFTPLPPKNKLNDNPTFKTNCLHMQTQSSTHCAIRNEMIRLAHAMNACILYWERFLCYLFGHFMVIEITDIVKDVKHRNATNPMEFNRKEEKKKKKETTIHWNAKTLCSLNNSQHATTEPFVIFIFFPCATISS